MHINVDECGKSNDMTVPSMIINEWWKKPAPNGRFTIGFVALCILKKMMITYDNYAVQAMHFWGTMNQWHIITISKMKGWSRPSPNWWHSHRSPTRDPNESNERIQGPKQSFFLGRYFISGVLGLCFFVKNKDHQDNGITQGPWCFTNNPMSSSVLVYLYIDAVRMCLLNMGMSPTTEMLWSHWLDPF